LNATGDPLIDEIYIEYNGFLVNRTLEHIVVPSLYEYIATMLYQWEEFYFDGVSEHMNLQSNALINMKTQRRRESINYVDLDEVRKVGGNYISLLGPNTRYNIRRSIKEFNKVGPITLTVAENMDEALDYLSKLKELHQAYWQSKGKPGSFSNAFFERFHDNLIRTRFRYGDIQLIQANAGNFSIGYLYNFLYRGTVYNYQTGFNYSICKSQFRPGFVAHSQAIELNANLGQNIYDFMAGESGYKKSLGTHTRNLDWLLLQRDLLKFRLEDKLRQIKYCFIPEPKAQVEN
jgi:CelD/BcsL family acetyltransferase involved in cellulose biosynthesis